MRPIAVVQHEPAVPPGSIAEVLEERDVDHFVVEAWREPAWPRAGDLGGVVVMGGTMNADEMDGYPFLRESRALIGSAIESGLPALGVCLGAQIMARALSGEVFRAASRNALFSPIEITAPDEVVLPFESGTPVLQFHEDTFSIPAGAVALARSSATGLHQAFRYGERAYAVQFHFEVDETIVKGWCEDIGEDRMASEWGTSTGALMDDAARYAEDQLRAGKELFTRFLQRGGVLD